jgi:hypothetical protein
MMEGWLTRNLSVTPEMGTERRPTLAPGAVEIVGVERLMSGVK